MTIDLRTSRGRMANRRQAIIAHGPDAVDFLQGQLSQDVSALAPGEAAWSLVLHPQGKISAWFRITRTSDDRFVLDVDTGWADEVLARLNRFKLRTKIDISLAPWDSLTIVGPDADDVAMSGIDHDMIDSWAGVPVRDVFGEQLGSPDPVVPELDAETLESLRIEAGVPKMGAELDESTIPAAAGIVDRSVSFTKGCYTGQELVARIDSRGNNVPKRLLGIALDGDVVPEPGAVIRVDDDVVGEITSASHSDHLGTAIALGYVKRAASSGQQVAVAAGSDNLTGELRELPLVRG